MDTDGYLLIDHGSRRAASNVLIHDLAQRLQARRPTAKIAVAHLELAPPSIPEGFRELAEAGCRRIAVLPYFLGPGRHVQEDIPKELAEIAREYPAVEYHCGGPLGPDDVLIDLLLRRAGEEVESGGDTDA